MVKIGNFEVKSDLLYLNTHVWVNRVSDSEALIGLTDYGQQTLKDITSIQMPSEGERYASKSNLMLIESISQDYQFKSPASCVILEINRDVASSPDLLNEEPYEYWIVRVEVLDLGDFDDLFDSDTMADMIMEEAGAAAADIPPLDDDFDYESEFSIDSTDSYYEEDQDDYW